MKLFIAFLGGFGLTLLSFGGGIALAIVYFTAEPVQKPGPSVDTAATWPSEPVRVENDDGLQRLPDRPASTAAPAKVELAADAEPEIQSDTIIDTTTTASVERADREEPEESTPRFDRDVVMLRQQHLDWCWRRYNSYRPEDNSYQPYGGGGRKPCLSPFLDEAEFTAGSGEEPAEASGEGGYIQAELIEPSAGEGPTVRMTREHIQRCFERYRSYRPEDNSYQPYGGGPRRQCR